MNILAPSRDERIIEVLRTVPPYELARERVEGVENFSDMVLKVLEQGALAARVYIKMYLSQGEWSTVEMSRVLCLDWSVVYRALKRLEKIGIIKRISRHKWIVI